MQEKKTAVMTLLARNPSPSTAAAGPQDSGVVLVTGDEPTAKNIALIPVALLHDDKWRMLLSRLD